MAEIKILGAKNSIFNNFMAQVRDNVVQRDSMRFRRNLERIGEIMSYEISKTLNYKKIVVETPLGESEVEVVDDKLVIATVLRAGLPLHQGFLNYFDNAQSAFVAAYRKNSKDGTFKVKVEYVSSCDLEGKVLLLVDPMLATGQSLCLTYEALLEKCGKPLHTHIASVVASEQGVDYAMKHLPSKSTTLWVGAVDEELTSRAYIVPGIGDAGDLAFGEKV
ncbi:MAG: uracil phosphoribosyltransferase [Alistipes sp.]|nr:uracil phosphoribosyltransferase [Rikenellaceae bacterium]MBQ3149498.1 uracil phosphoribosyltransferase [Alistipes sp.]MBQ4128000.1 uracil phosphoribosyltransferase [Alistipes sp.]